MLRPPGDWVERGVCREVDPELWFQESGNDVTARLAKRICWDRCHVRLECLEYALDNGDEFGIFGGYSAKERRHLKRSRGT